MLILLSCAKTMSDVSKVKVPFITLPRFQKEASEVALRMSQFSVEEFENCRGELQALSGFSCGRHP